MKSSLISLSSYPDDQWPLHLDELDWMEFSTGHHRDFHRKSCKNPIKKRQIVNFFQDRPTDIDDKRVRNVIDSKR